MVSQQQFNNSFCGDESWQIEGLRTLSARNLERGSLQALDGCQRIHAATELFSSTKLRRNQKARDEDWWIANIYLGSFSLHAPCTSESRVTLINVADTLQHSTLVHIKRSYTITELSEGDLYRKQRIYELGLEARLPTGEATDFKASISDSKIRKLKSFSKDEEYQAAFDALLPVRGLWEGFQIGNINILVSIKAKDVSI